MGRFRGEGKEWSLTPDMSLGDGRVHTPPATTSGAVALKALFDNGADALEAEVADPGERAMAWFLFGALQQFHFGGNKRTARFMMNGMLMSHGYDAIPVPAARALEFNREMVDFCNSQDGSRMMEFLIDCRPRDRQAQPKVRRPSQQVRPGHQCIIERL